MLDTQACEDELIRILDDQYTRVDDPAKAQRDLARDLTRAFTSLIRSATVTGTVNTTGTAAAQAGPLLNGTIS